VVAIGLLPVADAAARTPQTAAHAKHHKKHHKRHHKKHRKRHRRHKHKATHKSPAATTPPSSAPTAPGGNPFAGARFYVDPGSSAAKTQSQWASQGRAADAAMIGKIASQPSAEWFGDWSDGHGGTAGDVNWWVSKVAGAGDLPVLVAYDMPWRDCSQYSSGGAASPAAYQTFIDQMAQGIAGRRAVVILEPDALAELDCLSSDRESSYYSLLQYAVAHLSANPLVSVYLDVGNAGWQSAATMASRLRNAGVAGARGFALNVSNFDTTQSEIAYGTQIAQALGISTHFLIDTSRNGQGRAPGGAWCNPPGRGLGSPPTAQTASPLVDAYFWVKLPGESDGTCNGGPSAGTWWPDYALGLARNAVF
jgi:endoglucanase